MIVTKEVKNFLGPPICVHWFRSPAVAFGKTFTLDLKFDLNQSVDQMKVESFCKSVAFNSYPNYIGSIWDSQHLKMDKL